MMRRLLRAARFEVKKVKKFSRRETSAAEIFEISQ